MANASSEARCFKCKKSAIRAARASDATAVLPSPACRTEVGASNRKDGLWDRRAPATAVAHPGNSPARTTRLRGIQKAGG